MNKNLVCRHLSSLLVFAMLVLLALGSTESGSGRSPSDSARTTPKAASPAPTKGTEARLKHEIEKALGSCNRKVSVLLLLELDNRETGIRDRVQPRRSQEHGRREAYTEAVLI